ncbi:hypothetical protein GCM10029992_26480 [Glycomyces albus]
MTSSNWCAPRARSVPGDAVAGAAAAGCLNRRTAGIAAASVCLYWAGMAANDWADRELDAVERPTRPIPSGRVGPGQALLAAGGLTATGLAIAAAAEDAASCPPPPRWRPRSGPTTSNSRTPPPVPPEWRCAGAWTSCSAPDRADGAARCDRPR